MSNAEARSWWADVQHLRPDAPAGSVLLSEPDPAEHGAGIDPLLVPAPGRRFARRSAADPDARVDDGVDARPRRDADRPDSRRIVLLRDGEHRDPAPSRHAGSAPAPGQRSGGSSSASAARPARAPAVDVDFDFGRAAEDRARRRTAERLRSPARPTDGAAATGSSSRAAPAGDELPAGPAGSADAAPPLHPGSVSGATGPALVPLAPPAPRGGRLARRGGASPAADRRRRPRGGGTASQPDRIALWAVVLGILLIALAAASSRAEAATHTALRPLTAIEQTAAAQPATPRTAAADHLALR